MLIRDEMPLHCKVLEKEFSEKLLMMRLASDLNDRSGDSYFDSTGDFERAQMVVYEGISLAGCIQLHAVLIQALFLGDCKLT